jgi:hypothetical protein
MMLVYYGIPLPASRFPLPASGSYFAPNIADASILCIRSISVV